MITHLLFLIFPPAVLEEFFHVRLEFYEKRKVSSLMFIGKSTDSYSIISAVSYRNIY